jgi:hypothetical protein
MQLFIRKPDKYTYLAWQEKLRAQTLFRVFWSFWAFYGIFVAGAFGLSLLFSPHGEKYFLPQRLPVCLLVVCCVCYERVKVRFSYAKLYWKLFDIFGRYIDSK